MEEDVLRREEPTDNLWAKWCSARLAGGGGEVHIDIMFDGVSVDLQGRNETN